MHPAIGREDPEGGKQRAQRHHTGREEVQAAADAMPAKQHDAKKASFEEEGGQDFIGQQRPGNTTGELREPAPVSAKLIGHHQPGNDAHTKINGKYF